MMFLEFFKQGQGAPRYYDMMMNKNGRLLIINPHALKTGHLKIVLEPAEPMTPGPHQIVGIYAMISRYKWCEVALYNMDA
jgi:hypothetical protein